MQSWYRTPGGIPVLKTVPTRPAAPHPILFIHENRGLSPYVRNVVEELAAEGFEIHAPDLLHRIGGTAAFAHDPSSVTTRQVSEDTHEADLIDVFDGLPVRPMVVGFCFGAEMGWRLALHRTAVRAALVYGMAPADVSGLDCPVFAAYAEDDPRVNAGLPALCSQLAATDLDYTISSYPGTLHAFHDHTRPVRFHPRAARAAGMELLEFLRS